MKKTSFILLLLALSGSVFAQQESCYSYYSWTEFLAAQDSNAAACQQAFDQSLRYPAICRENNLEGALRFLLVYHASGSVEVYQKDRTRPFFEQAVLHAFQQMLAAIQPSEAPFVIQLNVLFEINPIEPQTPGGFDFVRVVTPVELIEVKSH